MQSTTIQSNTKPHTQNQDLHDKAVNGQFANAEFVDMAPVFHELANGDDANGNRAYEGDADSDSSDGRGAAGDQSHTGEVGFREEFADGCSAR